MIQINMDDIAIFILLMFIFLIAMRVMYGYWPWQNGKEEWLLLKKGEVFDQPVIFSSFGEGRPKLVVPDSFERNTFIDKKEDEQTP